MQKSDSLLCEFVTSDADELTIIICGSKENRDRRLFYRTEHLLGQNRMPRGAFSECQLSLLKLRNVRYG